jgi:hypothetical protein
VFLTIRRNPRARTAAGEGVEIQQRAEGRFLHDIVGIVGATHEPACQAAARWQMRKNNLIKRRGGAVHLDKFLFRIGLRRVEFLAGVHLFHAQTLDESS